MWRRWAAPQCQRRLIHTSPTSGQRFPKVIDIEDATCYRRHPAPDDTPESNPPLFLNLSFRLYKDKVPYGRLAGQEEHWAILSPSSLARTTLLQILGGQHICIPPTARSYPALSEISKSPQHAIRYVGFDAERGSSVGGSNVRGAYLSARYESRREETDYSLMDYLTGHTELNALEHVLSQSDKAILDEAIQKLDLQSLLTMPVANLSNGQTRRARIAKALMARPEVLLLDGPYMGLDPNTLSKLDTVLYDLAERQSPRLVLSLRPEDGVPDWITHLVVTDDTLQVLQQGSKHNLFEKSTNSTSNRTSHQILRAASQPHSTTTTLSKDAFPRTSPPSPPGEPLVELSGVKVSYGSKTVLGDWQQPEQSTPGLHWTLHRGQRAGIFGPNGSGKTTLLSLLTSDHPQTYALPIKHFGRSRLPDPSSNEPGISLFDIQRRIGHSSPEIHAFFPKNLSIRRAIESAWSDAPLAKPHLTADADRRVDAILRWFAADLNPSHSENLIPTLEATYHKPTHQTKSTTRLEAAQTYHDDNFHSDADLLWADSTPFRTLPFSSQRLVLFLRSIVHSPDLVILDEAFSGMDEDVRDKALLFLSHGETIKAVESVLQRLGKVTLMGLNERQGLVVISHSKDDVPGCVREWICLPEPGEGRTPRMGRLKGPLELMREGWGEIWGSGV
ncbi:hypothetical protein M409DRAFT_58317 [Zasmidium cellare ATCC 36951]|uniref:ABC transporter domain-containing protein n=1 Tax=Zasmidium cellare ATCC 36951 TaxID=1080233 RepID=A0A6A6C8L8_ZASCE|nr:uncharacterized protein M409DRAFT_58317 [Zasmidium cellare ATCC 36951]KAF2162580.1 hypothetical protein M409DRAFT_58317 [Zasmidium cellare ATCC 36951]